RSSHWKSASGPWRSPRCPRWCAHDSASQRPGAIRSSARGGAASGRRHRIPDNQLGHGHAGAEARHELVGLVLDADRILCEGGSAEPVPSLLGGGEVVDLQLDTVAVGIAIVNGGGGPG